MNDNVALACDRSEDCPLGPEPHQFVPPADWGDGALCCCRQRWERDA